MKSKTKMFYRIAKSYLKARLFNTPAPISALINITNQCPKGCCYCDSWKQPPMDMETENVFLLLKALDDSGVSRITFHGGDPLMHPDIGSIVREAHRYNFFITISVRESLIENNIDVLKWVDLVFISFDGDKKAHDAQKGDGSFDELIDAFQTLKDNGIPFQTTTVVTRLNVNDIDFILETAKKYDFQAHLQPLQFPPFKNVSQSSLHDPEKNSLTNLMPTKAEYAQFGKKMIQLKDEGENIATSKEIIRLNFIDWPNPALSYLPYRLNKSIRCWAGLLFSNIAVTGELYPCGYYNPAYFSGKLANVFNEGFAEAMKHNIVDNSCQTCMLPCYMELNAMFSLHVGTIMNWLEKVFKK